MTTFGYDGAHRVISVLDPAQHSGTVKHPMTMVYDGQGVTSHTDPLGRVTTFAYTGDPFSAAGHQHADAYQCGVRSGRRGECGYSRCSRACRWLP